MVIAAASVGTRRMIDRSSKGECLDNRMVKGVSGSEGSLRGKKTPDLKDVPEQVYIGSD